MPNIFHYADFREYLQDLYEEKKAANKRYSYKTIADKAGFQNKGFVYNLIHGKKNLSRTNLFRLSKALGHTQRERDYFENMVGYTLAKTSEEQDHFYKKMIAVNFPNKEANKTQVLRKDQYEYYSKFYHSIIRSLIDMHPFRDDFDRLAKMISPPITPGQAKKSVELLEKLGLIRKKPGGHYEVSDKIITTGKSVAGPGILNFHLETMGLAARAARELPKGIRNITGLTLGISAETYEAICEEIRDFRKKILGMAEKDDKADRVYQLNFHLFPVSKKGENI